MKLARLPLSAPLTLIIETFMASIEALVTEEQQLTDRLVAIKDPRCGLLETIPAIGPPSARWWGCLMTSSGLTTRRWWPMTGRSPPLSLSVARSGSWGGSTATGGWRSAESSCTGPIRWHGCTAMGLKAVATIFRAHRPAPGEEDCGHPLARKLLATAYGGVRKSGQPYDPRKVQPAPA